MEEDSRNEAGRDYISACASARETKEFGVESARGNARRKELDVGRWLGA
jgi:hypothetical protein